MLLVLSERPDEGRGLNDLDGMEVFEIEQMRIARDDVVGLALQGTGEELVIRGIRRQKIGGVQVLGENSLTKHQTKEARDGVLAAESGVECQAR